jgi:hypothetical protein
MIVGDEVATETTIAVAEGGIAVAIATGVRVTAATVLARRLPTSLQFAS